MTSLSIIPIIISFAFIFLIVIILSKVLGSKVWTAKVNQWIVLGYLALGLISLGVLSVSTEEVKKYSNEERKAMYEDETGLWNSLLSGQKSSDYEKYLQKEWEIELTSDQIRIVPHLGTDIKADVIVETRVDPNSNVIYAKTYVIPYQYRGNDFTKHASLDYFKFENNDLIVQQVNNQEFRFYEMYPGMQILDQINDNNIEHDAYYSFFTGRTILFLNVPSHVNIIDESGYIYYVR